MKPAREFSASPIWRKLAKLPQPAPWEEVVNAALFDPQFGYYRKNRRRVGGDGADFYTSVSLKGRVFSELIAEAAAELAKAAGYDADSLEFYEIGAEPETQIIAGSRAARLGDKIEIPERAIVISNELPDARPFERFVFSGGKWLKKFLEISEAGGGKIRAEESLSAPSESELSFIEKYFFPASVEGFSLDISFDALELFEGICAQNWRGVLIFADYFRSAAEICELPNGTARTYKNHKDSADILSDLSEADITHSPCFEPFADIAKRHGFGVEPQISQERFFMKFARRKIESIMNTPDPFDMRKRELAQLLSPVFMGSAFRVLAAAR